jgi:hypothetical protein
MSGSSLNVVKNLKQKMAEAEARALLGALLTIGFVVIQVLVIYKLVDTETYVVIMQWYVPIQAVVVGFYFGTPKAHEVLVHDNGTTQLQWTQELDKVKEAQVMLAGSVRSLTQTVQQLAAKLEA